MYTFLGTSASLGLEDKLQLQAIVSAMADFSELLICSCEGTMPLDAEAIRRGCRGEATTATQLCHAELDRFRAIAAKDTPLTVGCTQQASQFSEVAAKSGRASLAAAAEPTPPVTSVQLESGGVVLVCGRDDAAVEAGQLLKDHLDVTVLIEPPATVAPPRTSDFPVAKGRVRNAQGYLGAFELTVDDFAEAAPSSRGALAFGPSRNGARSSCDIILDLTGGPAFFPAADLRDGYLRADPGNPAAMLRAVLKARDLIGSFEKPRYVAYDATLCAHSRSKIVGCTRCLDLCPTAAITPAGDHVTIDANICAGCGQCTAACPTGAASYALPAEDVLMRKLRAMLMTYREAGGKQPILLVHDDSHGLPLIDALARFGDGLPAHVLPFAVNATTQVGLESVAAAFAYGASAMRFLLRARPAHDLSGLHKTIALATSVLTGLGFGPAPQVSARLGRKEASCVLRSANCIARHRFRSASSPSLKGRRLEPSKSTSRAVRCVCPACRHARPAHCATTRIGRCCALSKTPVCSVAFARQPAPKMSSHSNLRSISTPSGRRLASSRKRNRSAVSVAASRSE